MTKTILAALASVLSLAGCAGDSSRFGEGALVGGAVGAAGGAIAGAILSRPKQTVVYEAPPPVYVEREYRPAYYEPRPYYGGWHRHGW